MEGGLGAPERHPLDWKSDSFYDTDAIDAELRRVFDICHGCRLCFNLCDSFPRLFDLIDESPNEEVEDLSTGDLKKVVDACTLCDMCFMVKCPYVPPHEFDLDFPHLMLRHRAVENRKGKTGFVDKQLAKMDRNAKLGGLLSEVTNWATSKDNGLTRGAIQAVAGIDTRAHLQKFDRPAFGCYTPWWRTRAERVCASLWQEGGHLCHLLWQFQRSDVRQGRTGCAGG